MIHKPTRILHIIKSLGRGGAEMLLPETLKLHDTNTFEFHYVYFLPWKNQMVESIEINGGRVTCIAASNNAQLMLKVNKVIRYVHENNIALIHSHLPWAGILARLVAKQTGVPVIYTEHNKQERYHFITRWMNLLTINATTRLIAVSRDVAESVHRHKRKLKPSLCTIVNGVNTDHFNPTYRATVSIRAKLGIPNEAMVIGTIAVFRFQKRLDLWMELAREISLQFKNTHFIIVGDGPLKHDLLKKRQALGLEDRLHMPGLQTEIRPYLAAFDIYMMSSIFEGLPVALLEAMSMSRPIISTDAGGTKEVIRHDVDGLLCATHSPKKLVDHAHYLLLNEEARKELGARARDRVIQSFSMKKMVSQLESLYREILQ